jgi:hypothetical protein
MRNNKYILKNSFVIPNETRILKEFKYYFSLSFVFIEICNLKQIVERIKIYFLE